MPDLHPAERLATFARLAEVRQVLAAIHSGDIDTVEAAAALLKARERLYAAQVEPPQGPEEQLPAEQLLFEGQQW